MKTLLKRLVAFLCLTCITFFSAAQQVDLFKMQDSASAAEDKSITERTLNTFYSTRLVTTQTVEITGKGSMDFRINHRFAPLNQGFYNLFGLDFVSARIGFDFGLSDNLMVGIGRTGTNKEGDAFLKYRVLRQQTGKKNVPVTISLLGTMAYRGIRYSDPTLNVKTKDRIYYTAQLMVARKFNEHTSLQVSPTYTRYNRKLFLTGGAQDLFSIGFLARQKVSRKVSINAEYFVQTQRFDGTYNPLSIGVDIQTGGHVFQLHFTNSIGMNEHTFIHETFGSWGKGDIRWGFNISRIFNIGKKKK